MDELRWQPSASIELLKHRAELLRQIREWFYQHKILEVETPVLVSGATTDPHIDSFQLCGSSARHLRTSSEFHQKRLLAAGSGDIFEIGKVFRVDERGRYHNPEFTMLEWYRCGIDHYALIDEAAALLAHLHGDNFPGFERISYRSLWSNLTGIDIATGTPADLARYIESRSCEVPESIVDDYDLLLDLGMSTVIADQLPQNIYTCIFDYPASQASLARINTTDSSHAFACRFEVYFGSVELANGYHELTDGSEQKKRFESDNQQRQVKGKTAMPVDYLLIDALNHGLPDCAGVAIGLDRLMMILNDGIDHLGDAISFDWARA